MMFLFEYSNMDDEENVMKTYIITCQFCGEKTKTSNDVIADHIINNGCEKCQKKHNQISERLLQQISNWDEIWKKDTDKLEEKLPRQ